MPPSFAYGIRPDSHLPDIPQPLHCQWKTPSIRPKFARTLGEPLFASDKMWGVNSFRHQMLYAPPSMKRGSILPAPLKRHPLTQSFAGAGAALLLAALGASAPGHAQTAPVLVPATVQSSALEGGFALPDQSPAVPATDTDDAGEHVGTGLASWYGKELKGRRTASGEPFDPAGFTAAHRSLPFGSLVRVTNTGTGKSVVVRINDRGPFTHKRMIDVSQAAARELGLIGPGSGQVSISLLSE